MSKQEEAKKTQGFRKKPAWPVCGNCKMFKMDIIKEKGCVGTYKVEKNIRCGFGNFKVGKTDTCKRHEGKYDHS